MNLIIICGAPASGKMTVGQELQKLTNYKLFHNHMSIKLVNQFFDFGMPNFRKLDKKIRFDIFKEIADSEIAGLIFTYVWAFNEESDETYVDEIVDVFKKRNPKVCFVELNCALEERLIRNKGASRLEHKPSKRNIELSEKLLLANEKTYRMESLEGEFQNKNFFKINNTELAAAEVASKIVDHFSLT